MASMVEDIEEIDEDVRLFTDKDLRLDNGSRPKLETEEEFHDTLERENVEMTEDGERRAIMDNDLIIYLNALDKNWSAAAIAFFQPYAFFLERTDLGRQLRESNKTDTLDERYPSLGGISRWIELETINRLKTKGYNFNEVLPEITNELNSSQYYKGYEICRRLWKTAHESDLGKLHPKAEPNKIIVAGILSASSDVSRDFNDAFLKLENMPILDIFTNSDLYGITKEKSLTSEEIEFMEKCIDDIGFGMGIEKQIGDIRESLRKLEEITLRLGRNYENNSLKRIGEQALNLYSIIKSHPPKLRIEELPDQETYTMLLQTLLSDSENFLKSCR